MSPRRTNDEWLADLRGVANETDVLEDLRELARRGLAKALASRAAINDADLEDFAQETVMRVLDRLDTFRGDSRFQTWVMAIALRVAFTEYRRRRWGDVSLDDLEATGQAVADTDETSDHSAGHHELLEVLQSAIDSEPTERQRTAIRAELAGMPQAFLIEQLGTNRNALYKLLHDARQRLKTALAVAGFAERDVRRELMNASEGQ